MKQLPFTIKCIFIAGCYCSAAYGQGNEASKNIITKLAAWSANHLVEKAYLQFDKPYYAAGDTIYFKAYVTKGEQHRLSDLSGVLHVDLINTKSKVDQSIQLQLDSGLAWGDFALPDSLPKGNYRVRAYTQLMRNDDDAGFFDKLIPVGSLKARRIPESLVKQPGQALTLKPDMQFFPEGGSLVTGIRSKVAFKAIGTNGLGISVKGKVVDDEGNEIVSFTSANLGMGYFYLSPAEGKTYKANIIYPNGARDVIDLPKPELSGIVLSVNNDSLPKASVRIEANQACYLENRDKDYTLVIYSGGIATTVTLKLDCQVITLDILKRRLHTGIATVTLFSPEGVPLSERLLFNQNYDQLALNVTSDKSSYAKKGKVNIRLNAINRKGDPAEGHFSVSVVDESKVAERENNGDNILTYFLLTSDLKGYIEQPNRYFSDTAAAVRADLDILMLTQGYRRFTWKQILDDANQTLSYQPEKGIEIDGQVKSLFGRPVANGTVTLISRYKGPVFSSITDDKGMFHFSNLMFTDTGHFVLSAVNAKNKNSTKISYFGDKPETVIPINQIQNIETVSDTVMAAYLDNDKMRRDESAKYNMLKGKMLKEVKIKAKEISEYRSQSRVAGFAADQVIYGKDIPEGGPLAVRLSSLLHGVHIYPTPGNRYLIINNITRGIMKVLVDGTPWDINDLSTGDIDRIEVLQPPNSYVYGSSVGKDGVLVVTTKPRTMEGRETLAIGVLPIAPIGFYKGREFYSPKYESATPIGKQQDLRSTIYWKPELLTDKDGNASFDYYNADGTGTYKVIIEGIDINGNLGRQVYRYKVK